MFYSFEDYWKQFGRYQSEVIELPPELEKKLFDLCAKIWLDALGTEEETYDNGHSDGWDECEKHYKIKVDE